MAWKKATRKIMKRDLPISSTHNNVLFTYSLYLYYGNDDTTRRVNVNRPVRGIGIDLLCLQPSSPLSHMPRKDQPGPITAQAQQDLVSEGLDNFELPKSLVTKIAKSNVSCGWERYVSRLTF
jgi:hypothetical protein